MLDATLKTQLKSYLEKVVYPLELVASLDDSAKAREMKELLQEIVLLSDKITLVERTRRWRTRPVVQHQPCRHRYRRAFRRCADGP